MNQKLSTIVFYNTENFYSKKRDGESSFLPSNFSKWEEKRYDQKVKKIAYAISRIGAKETNDYPLFIGLSEIENEFVLKDLIKEDYLIDGDYDYVIFDSLDERKINVACIYRKEFLEILASEPIRVVFKNKQEERSFTRDILFLKTKLADEIIYIFIVHLPSKLDFEINQNKREILLQKIQDRINILKKEDNNPNIILMGDFNDSPTSENIRCILNTTPTAENIKNNELYNPMVRLLSYKRGTLVHKKQWMLFDQMLFSNRFFLKQSRITWVKTEIFDEPFLTMNEAKTGAFPFRTFVGTKYLGGYSDHFPIYTIIKH